MVAGRFRAEEGLRTDDVGDGVGGEEHGAGGCFFGIACDVGGEEGVQEAGGGGDHGDDDYGEEVGAAG